MSNKIKSLIEELKSELEKETGIEPKIDIDFHRSNQGNKKMSLLEAHTKYNNINKKLNGNTKYNLRYRTKEKHSDNYIVLSNGTNFVDTEVSLYFNDRRDEIEKNRQSNAGEAMQESELPELAASK